jgi:hypothetical protein
MANLFIKRIYKIHTYFLTQRVSLSISIKETATQVLQNQKKATKKQKVKQLGGVLHRLPLSYMFLGLPECHTWLEKSKNQEPRATNSSTAKTHEKPPQ